MVPPIRLDPDIHTCVVNSMVHDRASMFVGYNWHISLWDCDDIATADLDHLGIRTSHLNLA